MNYHAMMERALRGVIRESLGRAAADGLPGEHHFYITFDTTFPGVQISPQLVARFPQEMTIVLQHQYWGLEVRDDLFAVTLSFSDVQERLIVPFDAVTAFADPSVQFGLQFGTAEEDEDKARDGTRSGAGDGTKSGTKGGAADRKPTPILAPATGTKTARPGNTAAGTGDNATGADKDANADKDADKGGGNVVPLDAFRKK